MKITREKRPDRVICKWGKFEVKLDEDNDVRIINTTSSPPSLAYYDSMLYIPKSEIPNLIKALLEIQKETK